MSDKHNKTAYLCFKRLFDVLFSSVGIMVTSPLWLFAIAGIKLSDSGSAFYMASRVGKDNKMFKMYKFRSMRNGKADESVFRGDENRIFPFGQFIRATKIDELPQLLNILFGSMSIVGPRPAAVDQVNITRAGKYSRTSLVQAGLTGPSALYDYIYGETIQNEEEYERLVLPTRLNLDLYYIDHMSAALDLKMIWYTVVCVMAEVFHKRPEKILNELVKYVKTAELDS